jgi:hypothetical protein
MGTLHADGTYAVIAEEVESFHREGFVHLPGLLSEAEVAGIEVDYDRFLRREIAVPGKDYCDMAGDYGRDPADYSIINVMLPRRYYPAWQGNVLERRALAVAAQLQGAGMEIDYDQLLAKQPYKDDAVFAWHQDMAYWPDTPDTRTATVWCAIDDSTVENGCMRFVPATNRETTLRPHEPVFGGRGESHALGTDLQPGDEVVPVRSGGVTAPCTTSGSCTARAATPPPASAGPTSSPAARPRRSRPSVPSASPTATTTGSTSSTT